MLLFGKKTVDSVLAVFHKSLTDLEEVQSKNMQEAQRKQEEADKAIAARLEALGEANRAANAISQIKRIVGLEKEPGSDPDAAIYDLHIGRH